MSFSLGRQLGLLVAPLAALAGLAPVHAAAAPAFAPLPLVASAACWNSMPDDVLGAVRACAHKSVQVMTLAVRAGSDGLPRAATAYASTPCQPSANCVPLGDLLDLRPAPTLLLQVSPTLLDEVQAEVGRHGAADRILIEPVLERPSGDAAASSVARGLHYSRRQCFRRDR